MTKEDKLRELGKYLGGITGVTYDSGIFKVPISDTSVMEISHNKVNNINRYVSFEEILDLSQKIRNSYDKHMERIGFYCEEIVLNVQKRNGFL